MKQIVKMIYVFMIFNLVLLCTPENVNAKPQLFTVGQERFCNNMKNNAYSLNIGEQGSEFHPDYGTTTYRFRTKSIKDKGIAAVSTLVNSEGYVCRIWINGNSADGKNTFFNTIDAALNAVEITSSEQKWLREHFINKSVGNFKVVRSSVKRNSSGMTLNIEISQDLRDGNLLCLIGDFF